MYYWCFVTKFVKNLLNLANIICKIRLQLTFTLILT